MSSGEVDVNKTILVIDDEPLILQLIKEILEPEGYDVILAVDGVIGMQIFRDSDVDLVLLDKRMPGPEGNEVVQSIREISDVPIIMVSGTKEKGSTAQSLNLGADDYITKPFYPNELLLRVQNILKRTTT